VLGASQHGSSDTVWVLATGNGDTSNMNGSVSTPWDQTQNVRYSLNDSDADNGTYDFVWVQVAVVIPSDADSGTNTGAIWIHFRASTSV
jgi:uncharacterized membrane protein